MSAHPLLVGTILAAASATLHVRAEYRGPRWLVYVTKPLTTTVLLALALTALGSDGLRYQAAIATGLALSLLGDVFLMLPRDRFVAGLTSFLLAHIAYLVAFTTGTPLGTAPWLLVPFACAGTMVLRLLWPRLGGIRAPVALYVSVIVLMASQAAARAWSLHTTASLLAAVGAALFVASDSLLALNRFHTSFRSAQALVMGTYVTAQWLVALSVGWHGRLATPQSTVDSAEGTTLGRMSIDKQIHGDLEATSKGEMLTAGTSVRGSAGYVAFERVSGTLHGRRGTFVLQHTGTMTRGAPQLTIIVVPDSGTDQLVGLTGTMVITIANGRHSYDFEYTIANAP